MRRAQTQKKHIKEQEALVEKWKDEPIGTPVALRKDDGTTFITKTRSMAQMLSGHTAVIWVEGITGCYLLERVSKITDKPRSE
jgi:hypothetical protein